MSTPPVSIHPYFKVHAGKMEAALALLPQFIAKTATEAKVLYYDFTISGDVVACREAYADAEGMLGHVGNVGELLGAMLEISELIRLEIHGPAAEIEKLKEPTAHLSPALFVAVCGLER